MINSFLRTWQFISKHPLASRNRKLAIANWLKWQISSSILKMPAIFPWINQSKLVAERGMTGATGNIYAGLHEFNDMAFCLHLLRSGDLFVDVGASFELTFILEPPPKLFVEVALFKFLIFLRRNF